MRIVIFSKTQSTSLYRLMLQQVELSMLLRKGLLLFAIIKNRGLESRKSVTGIYFWYSLSTWVYVHLLCYGYWWLSSISQTHSYPPIYSNIYNIWWTENWQKTLFKKRGFQSYSNVLLLLWSVFLLNFPKLFSIFFNQSSTKYLGSKGFQIGGSLKGKKFFMNSNKHLEI